MLYSIVFPILIVVSLVGIIIFLMKKAPDLALLKEDEGDEFSKKSFLKNIVDGKKVNNRLLLILEKMTRKFKLMFLKLENVFSAWGESIKQKRRIKENEGKYSSIKENGLATKEKKIEKAENFFQRRSENKKNVETKKVSIVEKEEKPKIIEKKKDLFENILIERIAANPKDVEAYERLGEYYFEIENWNYAKECFKQVIKLNPQNVNVRMKMRKLGRILGE